MQSVAAHRQRRRALQEQQKQRQEAAAAPPAAAPNPSAAAAGGMEESLRRFGEPTLRLFASPSRRRLPLPVLLLPSTRSASAPQAGARRDGWPLGCLPVPRPNPAVAPHVSLIP